MSSYYGVAITQQGAALLAKLLAGQVLTLTNVVAGDGDVPDGQTPDSMTALVNPLLPGTTTAPVVKNSTVSMVLEFSSAALAEGFWLREFGIFADDPEEGEILLLYGTLGEAAQWISAASDGRVDIRRFPVSITVGAGVEVAVDWAELAWMTAEDVSIYCTEILLPLLLEQTAALIEAHDADEDAHPALQQKIRELEAMLALLKLQMNTGTLSGSSFSLSFTTLEDAVVTGVWNAAAAVIEF